MKILLKITLTLIIIGMCTAATYVYFLYNTGEPTGPRYTFAAFSSYWNKNAIPSIKLRSIVKIDDGYLVNYGNNTTLTIFEQDKMIVATCANFNGRNNAGGMAFIRIKNRMLEIGTFRWPEAKLTEVKSMFRNIGKAEMNYYYRTSQFTLKHSEVSGWTMCLNFIAPKDAN